MLKYVLLGFLNYEPYTGYDLEHRINGSTMNFWHANLSQIYTTLKKLENDGLVVSHEEAQQGRPNRRVYEITPAGFAALQEWLNTPLMEPVKHKNTLMLKVFFASLGSKTALLTQLRIQRRIHADILAGYRQGLPETAHTFVQANPEMAVHQVLWQATLNWGVRYEESLLQWLDETIATVERELPEDQ